MFRRLFAHATIEWNYCAVCNVGRQTFQRHRNMRIASLQNALPINVYDEPTPRRTHTHKCEDAGNTDREIVECCFYRYSYYACTCMLRLYFVCAAAARTTLGSLKFSHQDARRAVLAPQPSAVRRTIIVNPLLYAINAMCVYVCNMYYTHTHTYVHMRCDDVHTHITSAFIVKLYLVLRTRA